jgi:hypothetical protein
VSFFLCRPVLYTAAPVVQTAGGGGGVSVYMCEWPIWPVYSP